MKVKIHLFHSSLIPTKPR